MTRFIADISIFLDGFATAAGPGPDSGEDLDVILMDGGPAVGPPTDTGLVGAPAPHVASVIPGSGTPPLPRKAPRTPMQRSVAPASTATHFTYDVSRVTR
jgi:hypothetical protein